METRNSTVLETSSEDSILIETVKSIVRQDTCNESVGESQDYFLVSQVQSEQYASETNVEEIPNHKHETETIAWTELCRICANVGDHLIPVFEGEGAEHDLSNKILKYLPIHISESDTLPLQLCYHCAATLLAWHKLSEGCLNAERRLLDMQDTLRHKTQYYNVTSLDNLEASTPVAATTTTITSNMTNLQPSQQDNDKNGIHMAEETNKANRWTVRVSSVKLTRHAHGNSQRDDQSDKEESSVNVTKIRSMLSNKKLVSSILLHGLNRKLGSQRQHTTDIQPNNTEKKQRLLKNYAVDFRESTGRNSKQTSEQRSQLIDSKVTEENGSIYYRCKECGKILSTSYNLLTHCNIHTGERPYVCVTCNNSFRSASGLNRHVRDVHNGIKNFACDVCARRFASRASRDEHRRTHTDERLHMCETCGKSFKQRASLRVHRLYHSQDPTHHCNQCDRGFRRKQDLDKHATAHSDRKPHACDVCGECFRNKSCVARHRHTHTNRKSHVCVVCNAEFTQERYLKRHSKRLHRIIYTQT